MHKSLLIIITFFLFNISLSLLFSCNKGKYDDDGCGGTNVSNYCGTLKDISVDVLRMNSNGYSYDPVTSSDVLRYYETALFVQLTGEKTICKSSVNNPFINTAYACTPPIPSMNFKGTIVSISIACDKDFDSTHPAGADIKEYFEFYDGDSDINIVEYDGGSGGIHKFLLQKQPAKNDTYTFTVTYHLTDGSKVQASALAIAVTK